MATTQRDRPVAVTVKLVRQRARMSREALAQAMRERGHDWTYDVVASVENGRRRVDTDEVASLVAIQRQPSDAYVHGLQLVPQDPPSATVQYLTATPCAAAA